MRLSRSFSGRVLAIAVGLGVCADQLFYGRWLGVSAPLFVALCLVALGGVSRAGAREPAVDNLWFGGAALGFAVCLALRAEPLLTALNLVASLGLLLLLVAGYRRESLLRLSGARVLAETLRSAFEMSWRPAPLVLDAAWHLSPESLPARRLLPVGRGLLLALPLVSCFTGLLMTADEVFASYVLDTLSLRLPFDLETAILHLVLASAVAWVCAGALLVAHEPKRPPRMGAELAGYLSDLPAEGRTQRLDSPRRPLVSLGYVEAFTVLLSVDALFGSFMLIQGAYFFGGMDTLERTGMTYAQYARRGFFELVVVACLSLALLWALALVTGRERPSQRRGFNAACAAMIVLVVGLLASAFQRMLLYEQAYGYTRLRVYTHSFMIWLMLVLLLFLLALLRDRPRIFTSGGFISALLYLAALNLASPDGLIVRENIARYQLTGKLDTAYLARLSSDATPALVDALGIVDEGARAQIEAALGRRLEVLQSAAAEQGWPAWHVSRLRAQALIERLPSGPPLNLEGQEPVTHRLTRSRP